jgi:transposase
VGGAPGPAAERSDDVARHPPLGLDAEKKTLAASERNEEERAAWRAAVATRDPAQFVVVDESGTNISLTRWYGWAPHEQRATGSAPRTHGKNLTLVAALRHDGLHTPWLIEGAMDTATVAWSIAEPLAPTLRPGQVVVVDHLRAHKADSMRHAIAARGCELLFLPPYSPDFTPIEQAFSKIKAILRGLGARTKETLQEAVRLAIEAITRHDALAWFAHAGYTLPAQAT